MTQVRGLLFLVPLFVGCQGGTSDGGDDDDDDVPLTYRPIVQYERYEFQGRPVSSYIPENPRGLVWLFHGTNGSVAYVNKIETIATTNLLILEGIGIVGSQSLDQGPDNQWDAQTPADGNPDAQFLLDLHTHLVDTTALSATTPQFTLGFSNGGDMAGYYALVIMDEDQDARAVAPHSSGGHASANIPLPMVFVLPENDSTGRGPAEGLEDDRTSQGLVTTYYEPPEVVPLTPEWFLRNPDLSPEAAQKTFDEMVRLELIDADGYRLTEIDDAEDTLTQWERDTTAPNPTLRTEEIRVAWAIHRMNGYYAHEVRDFFLDTL